MLLTRVAVKIPEPFPRQLDLLDALLSGKYKYLLYGGGVSGGKSFLGAWIFIGLGLDFPKSRFAIIRRNLTTLRRTTIKTFQKLLDDSGIAYTLNRSEWIITLTQTGSTFEFIEADETKDPDFNKLKGLEVSAAMIDEANEVLEQAFSVLITRVGRWNKNGCPMFIFLTCNPAQNWVKQKFYDPWSQDKLEAPYYFQQALPHDNPHNSKEYLEGLKDLPNNEYKRYVEGDWGYSDDPQQLISMELLLANQCEEENDDHDYAGIDVARYGDDTTVFTFANSSNREINKLMTYTKLDNMQVGERIVRHCRDEKHIPAEQVGVDAIGLGAGPVDFCHHSGYSVREYKSSEKPYEDKGMVRFSNKRAQDYWLFKNALQDGVVKVVYDLKLYSELTNTRYIDKNKVIEIESKKDIKKRLGFSPDRADSVIIVSSLLLKGKQGISTGQSIFRGGDTKADSSNNIVDEAYREYAKSRSARYSRGGRPSFFR